MVIATLLIIPFIVASIAFVIGKHKITWQEFGIQLFAQVLIAVACSAFMYWQDTHDTEVYNGRITGKQRVEVSCAHPYCCMYGTCCSGSGKSRSCYTCCKMYCDRHSFDVDWRVYTDIKETFEIARLSEQGLEQPPRWTAVKIGEPYSSAHSYTNYLKASPDSLFRHQGLVEKYKTKLPKYPQKIYDYHRLDRMVLVDYKLDNLKEWNLELSEVNGDIGPKVQANAVVVIGKKIEQDYFYALEQHWISGKKNDIIVVISVDETGKIEWTEVMSWSKDRMFDVVLRDHILEVGTLDKNAIMSHIRTDAFALFKRRPMSDFEYLKSAITPSPTQWVVFMLIGLFSSIGIAYFMYHNEFTDSSHNPFRRRY